MLQDTLERLFVQNLYADIERGLFLVRGENVSLLGEIVRLLAHTQRETGMLTGLRISTKTITSHPPSNRHLSRRSLL